MEWSVRTGVLHTLLQILCLNFVIGYNVHVDVNRRILSDAIFNASLGNGWSYYFNRWSRLKNINDVMSLDSTQGTVYIKNVDENCQNIHSNPLNVQILAKSYPLASGESFISNYSIISLKVYFHNLPCSMSSHSSKTKYSSSAKHSVQTVIYSDKFALWNKLKCMEKGVNVFYLNKHIPVSIIKNVCDVTIKNPNFQYHFENSSISTTRAQCLYESDLKVPLQLITCNDQQISSVYVSIHPLESPNTFIVESSHKDHSRLRRQTSNTAPSFAKTEYRASIPENQDAGYSVILITATDPDQGEDGKLTYSMTAIRDSRSNDMFTINPISGQVTTTKKLDREEIPRHDFQVTATDNNVMFKKSAVTTLTITVEDINDHTPTFDKDLYKVEKYENIPVATTITTVRAIDRDSGNNREIRYSIIVPANPSTFKIDPVSGSISTLKVLDREVQANYQLVVQAKDQASFGKQRSSSTTIEIKVLDENDNFPQFINSPYTVNVSENLDITSRPVIAQVSATDADEGRNQEITYSITGGNLDDTFYIDPTTGQVSVQKPLDYETNKQFNLKVKASDNGKVPKHNSTNVWIRIVDLNVNAPYFQTSVYTGSVFEGESIGTNVLTVRALDNDDGVNGQVSYSLVNVPPTFPFMIDPDSGEIKIRATIDREIQASYKFTVQAKDEGQPPLSAIVPVEVKVQDINDNTPVFDKPTYKIDIHETLPVGTSIATVRATDIDSGRNQDIKYSIIKPDNQTTFQINSSTGVISTLKILDREVKAHYLIVIEAKDQAIFDHQRSSTASMSILILDDNDNAPMFTQSSYNVCVKENAAASTSVFRVSAFDLDKGQNQTIRYRITGGNTDVPFRIDSTSGEVFTQFTLDRIKSSYSLQIEASDNGEYIRLSSTTTLNIYVMSNDVGNNPRFLKQNITVTVPENVHVGFLLTTINAVDPGSGCNSKLQYSFVNSNTSNSPFMIDAYTGEVFVTKTLDREVQDHYLIEVQASNHGSPSLSSTAVVNIRILDVNDNAPMMNDRKLYVNISDDTPIGHKIVQLNAIDRDISDKLTYAIRTGNDEQYFEIQSNTGIIMLKRSLLFTNIDNFLITVHAFDGLYFDIAFVYINVIGSHSFPLSFLKNVYTFSVVENQAVGSIIGKVVAVNSAPGSNSAISYGLQHTTSFSIDNNTGIIKTNVVLDRESQWIYRFEVQARTIDNRYQASAGVIVTIDDLNDNAPIFSKSIYETSIRKPVTAGRNVLSVYASDEDLGMNAEIRYSLVSTGNKTNNFNIVSTSGVIYVSQSNTIDQDSTGLYTLIVQAVDRGIVPLSAQTLVKIKVEEEIIPVG